MKKHPFHVRLRAFRIWQILGHNPWKKKHEAKKKCGDFYKGAFDSIPFMNDDAKRTFTHLLLRPGYMIKDYIEGKNERYLAPLTSLIIFYAFFALVSSVMQPVSHKESQPIRIELPKEAGYSKAATIVRNTAHLLQLGYTYLNLDKHPEVVTTRWETALAALENTLRSQGIPLFIWDFFLLWFALSLALRRYKTGMAATAAASAYILCQCCFFRLFAVLITLGQSESIGSLLLLALLIVDLHQWLGVNYGKAFRLVVRTGLWYALIFVLILIVISLLVVLVAWMKGM